MSWREATEFVRFSLGIGKPAGLSMNCESSRRIKLEGSEISEGEAKESERLGKQKQLGVPTIAFTVREARSGTAMYEKLQGGTSRQ